MRKIVLVGILLVVIGAIFVLFGGFSIGGIGTGTFVPAIQPIYDIAHTPPLQPIYFALLIVLGIVVLAIGMRR